jgi:hypothetical protein
LAALDVRFADAVALLGGGALRIVGAPLAAGGPAVHLFRADGLVDTLVLIARSIAGFADVGASATDAEEKDDRNPLPPATVMEAPRADDSASLLHEPIVAATAAA